MFAFTHKKHLLYLKWSRSTGRESAKLHRSASAPNVEICSEFNDVRLTSQLVEEIQCLGCGGASEKQGRSSQWPPPDGKDSSTRNVIAGNISYATVIIEHDTKESRQKTKRESSKGCPAGRAGLSTSASD